MTIAFVTMIAIDAWLLYQRIAYSAEVRRLRASMTVAERERTDLIIEAERNKIRVAIELVRRQARLDKRLHLSIPLDSSRMYLEREGAILREMPIQLGPEKSVGVSPDTVRLAIPRGERTVVRVLQNGSWTVPSWVYTDRGLPPQPPRAIRGALGPVAFVLDGGTVIYSLPSGGPLADSAYVLPGSVRAAPADLRAILPNVQAGTKVYFH